MKNLVLPLALVGLAFAFGGCSNNWACGGLSANCCQSWDFYEKCDLVEGRRAMCCGAELGCEQGVIVTREVIVRDVEVIVEEETLVDPDGMPPPVIHGVDAEGTGR